jgi:RNase P subunit RPR2
MGLLATNEYYGKVAHLLDHLDGNTPAVPTYSFVCKGCGSITRTPETEKLREYCDDCVSLLSTMLELV